MTTRIGVLAVGDGWDPHHGRLPSDVDAIAVGYFAPDEVAEAIEAAGRPIAWNASILGSTHAELVHERQAAVRAWLEPHDLTYRGLRPFDAVETTFAEALQVAQAARALVATAVTVDPQATLVIGEGAAITGLVRHEARLAGLRVETWPAPTRPRGAAYLPRTYARARRLGIDQVDPTYRFRRLLAVRAPREPPMAWLFSSYGVYSRVLGRVAEPGDRWVVNSRTAAVGPAEAATPLWRFPVDGDRVARRSFLAAVARARDEMPLHVDGLAFRAALAEHPGSRHWLGRGAAHLVHEADMLRGWVHTVRPTEVRVANQWGAEGLALQICLAADVPTVQLQHGLLSDSYRTTPLLSDRMFVWSEAWTDQVVKGRATVHVGHGPPRRRRTAPSGNRVTYFTAATPRFPMLDPTIQRALGVEMLHTLATHGFDVAIRPHPADDIEAWRVEWALSTSDPLPVDRRPLDEVLDDTATAICHFSTIVVDCAAAGVPTVVLENHPFQLDDLDGIATIETSVAAVVRAVVEGRVAAPSTALFEPTERSS